MRTTTLTLAWALLCLFHGGTKILAQERFIDRNGIVRFEASEKLFEEVKATHTSVTAILDLSTHELAALALVRGFQFKNSLMQEHFNENYIASDIYPKATFQGTLENFDPIDLQKGHKTVEVAGRLEFHGQTKDIRIPLLISRKGNTIALKGKFIVSPEDFAIDIPKIVRNKIAKNVVVQINFKLHKKDNP